MKKMFTRFFFSSIICLLFFASANAQFPTIYATVSSGTWNAAAVSPTTTIWETFPGNATNTPGAQGTGTAYTGPAAAGSAVAGPSGTHVVYIRSGHTVTMNGANRSFHDLTIEAGGKLWANEAAARRLQLVNGGTGFAYPQTGTVINNGILGGAGDGAYFEAGTNCQNVTITGTGSTILQRLRVPGGLGSVGGGVINITIDQDISFTIANNYAASLIYNPQATDNYTLTLNAGKTLTIATDGGYFNNNSIGSGGGWGNYTYNINGTLNLAASTQTSNFLTAFSPIGGAVNLNVGATGSIITGAGFNSSPVAPGVANLNLASGAVVDATLAQTMNFNGNAFQMTGTASVKRNVPATPGTRIEFPLGVGGSYNPLTISGETGPAEVYTVGLTSVPVVPPPPATLPRAWGISEGTPGGNLDTLRFAWTTTDEGASGFVSTDVVYVAAWDPINSKWVTVPATISGTGVLADPYVARAVGVFVSTAYVLTNTNIPTPVALVNVKASKKATGIQVEFGNATELDVKNYVVEKSANGRNFEAVTTLLPKTNNGSLNSYTFLDAAPYRGVNSYRIKATEKSGTIKYSPVVTINTEKTGANVHVYPNPVKGNNVSIQLENLEKAVYSIAIYNSMGQKVYSKQLNHDGNSSTVVADLPTSVKTGVYRVQVSNAATMYVKNIIVE